MNKYVAFLRGINVGGRKLVGMDDLSRTFVSIGLKNVKTYIQSGNVLFESASTNKKTVAKQIEKGIHGLFKADVAVFLRSIDELQQIVKLDPFKKAGADVLIANHTNFDGSKTKLPAVLARKSGERHPYFVGNESIRRYLKVAEECAMAGLLRLK